MKSCRNFQLLDDVGLGNVERRVQRGRRLLPTDIVLSHDRGCGEQAKQNGAAVHLGRHGPKSIAVSER
jgi:hypothetical protein